MQGKGGDKLWKDATFPQQDLLHYITKYMAQTKLSFKDLRGRANIGERLW